MRQNELHQRVESLLAEAKLAVDDRTNGTMDRADALCLCSRMAEALGDLKEHCDVLQAHREDAIQRLSRQMWREYDAVGAG